jgi:hypothetical protein
VLGDFLNNHPVVSSGRSHAGVASKAASIRAAEGCALICTDRGDIPESRMCGGNREAFVSAVLMLYSQTLLCKPGVK